MPNQFYVEPMGGYGPSIVKGLTGIGAALGQKAAQEGEASLRSEAAEIMKRGNPDEIAEFSLKNPKIGEQIRSQIESTSAFGEQETLRQVREGLSRPNEINQILMSRAEALVNSGQDASQTLRDIEAHRTDPEGFKGMLEQQYALLDPQGYGAYRKATGADATKKGTANITDWNHYQELLKSDPAQAEQFARQVGIAGDKPTDLKPTTAMQNYEKWEAMAPGPERVAFGRMIGIEPKDSAAEARKRIEKVEQEKIEVQGADTTIGMVDNLLGNDDYINAITGLRGATPFAVPGGVGFDATVAFEQLKDSLTLENLDKMSGILSDSDIKLLASAGSGLKAGMSEEALRGRLNKIKSVIMSKSAEKRARLKKAGLSLGDDVGATEAAPSASAGQAVNWSDL